LYCCQVVDIVVMLLSYTCLVVIFNVVVLVCLYCCQVVDIVVLLLSYTCLVVIFNVVVLV
jgi:hypothetical protein